MYSQKCETKTFLYDLPTSVQVSNLLLLSFIQFRLYSAIVKKTCLSTLLTQQGVSSDGYKLTTDQVVVKHVIDKKLVSSRCSILFINCSMVSRGLIKIHRIRKKWIVIVFNKKRLSYRDDTADLGKIIVIEQF